jgi:hypothetical protein
MFRILQISIQAVEIKPSSMDWKLFIISCSYNVRITISNLHVLINSGARGIAFIEMDCVHHDQMEGNKLEQCEELEVIDIRPRKWRTITSMTK